MKLQTCLPLTKSDKPIDHNSQLLLLGSCFAEHIGDKLSYFKFRSLQNPLGILFHPPAIEKLIEKAITEDGFQESDTFFLNERWHCFDAHSDLSNPEREGLLEAVNTAIKETNKQIRRSTHLMITLGTAWAYRLKSNNTLVANCHKVPQKEFSKELLSVKEISDSLDGIVNTIRSLNKKIEIVFTISPVRHLKDGFIENQQSKAHLFCAVHQALKDKKTSYFPAYEIMMDELRDYRFYRADMVHPNELAIEYIWEKFKENWISGEAWGVMEKIEAVQKGLEHRPFDPYSRQHQSFVKSLQKKIAYLQKEYPFMEFDNMKSRI